DESVKQVLQPQQAANVAVKTAAYLIDIGKKIKALSELSKANEESILTAQKELQFAEANLNKLKTQGTKTRAQVKLNAETMKALEEGIKEMADGMRKIMKG
ncbi:MAG: hypothetical protein EB107_07450, partial [Proteobacteria bacterium]|nr:hypothetical protein [Pseudomonadota bacterium]